MAKSNDQKYAESLALYISQNQGGCVVFSARNAQSIRNRVGIEDKSFFYPG
jgi:hypothetical protein